MNAHAVNISKSFEAALRQWAAASKVAGDVGMHADARGTGAAAAAATAYVAVADTHDQLDDYATALFELCHRRLTYPHNPCPLVILAHAAGPGSQQHRQLHSLLASMVKVSRRTSMLGAR
jgi:hypothetical protein